MDIADASDKQVEDFQLFSRLKKKEEGPKYSGFCFNCDEGLEQPRRWCDSDCRTEWERRARRTNEST